MYDAKKLKQIEESLAQWVKKTQGILEKRPERKERFETLSGIPIERVYAPSSVSGYDYAEDLGFPGEASAIRSTRSSARRACCSR